MRKIADWAGPLVVALFVLVLSGCPKANRSPVVESERPAQEPVTPVAASGRGAVAEISQPEVTVAEEPQANEIAPVVSTEPAAPPESKERILLLAPGGPLIIDFVLTIDGRPHTEALARLVDEVLKLADLDGDGRTMWNELCACERIKYGQFGNLPINGDNSEKQIIERYDIARDGVVDRSELPRFLTRNAGGSRPFSIRGTLDHRGTNRNLAATWQILDENRDWVIDADERKSAAARLAAKDADDDEIVTAAELNPRPQTPDPTMMQADRRRRGPDAAHLLGEHADWLSVQRSLETQYGRSVFKSGSASPFSAAVFAGLDENHDGRLVLAEIKRLNNVTADIVLEVGFGGGPAAQPQAKLRQSLTFSTGKAPAFAEQPGRVTIALPDCVLKVVTNDIVDRTDFVAMAQQILSMYDQNKDGYLERTELPDNLRGQLGTFEAVDADGDGKAYPQEIEAYLSQQQAGLRAQIHARASDAEDLLFLALDVDGDQRLDSREIQRADERLTELDANGDGSLSPEELPEALTIVLARGSIETPDATFAIPPAAPAETDKKTPRWFIAMDANQDGVISRREFLGTAEQFERLDRDGSGLLEPAESLNGE